ncbi:uncharacterized protein [Physcomitrium patens]|uniref:uncharacterized protein isoform X2 n=1 Tax=Physcomitrium patens TaxID=3218 RepID=UPI000D162FDE|nr:uncharacterized protein LOC112284755 isoform X3 [Physcomitrium patens]|eukprot:XP_024380700.1 uncharacterized protein LOC112284755 isoform X3 [Physcomitrella patens]
MEVNDVSGAIVEAAWAALNTHQQETELKDLLAAEMLDNDKLRKRLGIYKKVIENLELTEAAAAEANIDNLGSNSARMASYQEQHTPDICDELQDKLSSPGFLHQLMHKEGGKPLYPSATTVGEEEGAWLFESDDTISPKEERDELGTNEGYVIITQQDIVDGVACFVARSITSLPQSKNMNPEELQQELRKNGKLRSLWNCAHLLYAATSWGSTALVLCKNPVIKRAAWMAVYTSCSIILGLFS